MSRTIIKEFGSRGSRRCLVIRETSGRYLVERYVAGKPKREPLWPLTRDNERRAARDLARLEHGKRLYRRIALEHRGNAEAAREAGRRARSA